VLPAELLEDAAAVRDWTARALAHAAALPPKAAKRTPAKAKATRPAAPKKKTRARRPGS
jgi:hypothetical protein